MLDTKKILCSFVVKDGVCNPKYTGVVDKDDTVYDAEILVELDALSIDNRITLTCDIVYDVLQQRWCTNSVARAIGKLFSMCVVEFDFEIWKEAPQQGIIKPLQILTEDIANLDIIKIVHPYIVRSLLLQFKVDLLNEQSS